MLIVLILNLYFASGREYGGVDENMNAGVVFIVSEEIFQKFGYNRQSTEEHFIKIFDKIGELYKEINIDLDLIGNAKLGLISIWEENKILLEKSNSSKNLDSFQMWWSENYRNLYPSADNAVLFLENDFFENEDKEVLGKAYTLNLFNNEQCTTSHRYEILKKKHNLQKRNLRLVNAKKANFDFCF